jgi:AraC-like DNA-binding protein
MTVSQPAAKIFLVGPSGLRRTLDRMRDVTPEAPAPEPAPPAPPPALPETRSHASRIDPTVEHRQLPGLDGIRLVRITSQDQRGVSYTPGYAIVAIYHGAFDGWYRGQVRTWRQGGLKLKEPGEVHRNVQVHAPFTLQVAMFEPAVVDAAAAALGMRRPVHFRREGREDGGRAASSAYAMHAALWDDGRSPFEREARVTEALADVLTAFGESAPRSDEGADAGTRTGTGTGGASVAVRRARAFLHDALDQLDQGDQQVTLDALAAHARLDKFHLVRAFRRLVGVPPYEYLTHLRIARASDLLARGVPAGETAVAVGFYDQSALTRHFVRIVGTTPARFARAVRSSPRGPVA